MNILITGTSSGVGFGLAKYYLDHEHTVYGISRKSNQILNKYINFKFLSQDLSRFEDAANNVSEFIKDVNSFNLVILNAGVINEVKNLKDTSMSEIQSVMDVNVWANKVLIDVLLNGSQHLDQIVAISSASSLGRSRGWNAYSLSKATLNAKIKLYANEHPETHFCALAPGPVDTSMQDYIYNLKGVENYPDIQVLKDAKDSLTMTNIQDAAILIVAAIKEAMNHSSGSYLDARVLAAGSNSNGHILLLKRIFRRILSYR